HGHGRREPEAPHRQRRRRRGRCLVSSQHESRAMSNEARRPLLITHHSSLIHKRNAKGANQRMTRCHRLICCAAGAMLALSATGCGSVSRLVSGKSVPGTGSSAKGPKTVGSFVASVDVRQGKITFRSDKAATTGKARTAAQQFGPGDGLTLTGTASYSGSILTGTVTLTSGSGYALNDVRAV